ncbi:hypothetical protein TNCT_637601, partial [Trichonephila clavata]
YHARASDLHQESQTLLQVHTFEILR